MHWETTLTSSVPWEEAGAFEQTQLSLWTEKGCEAEPPQLNSTGIPASWAWESWFLIWEEMEKGASPVDGSYSCLAASFSCLWTGSIWDFSVVLQEEA